MIRASIQGYLAYRGGWAMPPSLHSRRVRLDENTVEFVNRLCSLMGLLEAQRIAVIVNRTLQ